MANLQKSYIAGIGHYTPDKILTNHDLEQMVDTNDEWITTRTGIKERRIAADEQASSDLGIEAARRAMAMANTAPEDVDLIIVATITPDYVFPATACIIQNALGCVNAGVFDLEAACSGFIYGLSIARQFIAVGEYKTVLVVAAEVLSRITDWQDRNTCILFGDAAGAAVVKAAPDDSVSELLGFSLGGSGAYADLLKLPAGGSRMPATVDTVGNRMHYMKMEGNKVLPVAVKNMGKAVQELLQKLSIMPDDVKLFIPHQANIRIIKGVAKQLDISEDRVMVNIDKYGNTSAATVPIALSEAAAAGRIERGDLVTLVAFGGGFTWAAGVLKW